MTRNRKVLTIAAGVIVIAAVLLVAATYTNRGIAQSDVSPSEMSPNSSINAGPFDCTIANLAVFTNRIHVKCTTTVLVGTDYVQYFSAPGDSANALSTNRFLMMLNTAYAMGKHVALYYIMDSTQNPTGCNFWDCRKIDWMYIAP